ncbi:hypothetical protein HMPREF0262_00088 [Clostridium sp. ATCC 29733]|nr:hypothetical protein HMPREF0262_00088 [Clostridium sp. ATCC 29733]
MLFCGFWKGWRGDCTRCISRFDKGAKGRAACPLAPFLMAGRGPNRPVPHGSGGKIEQKR